MGKKIEKFIMDDFNETYKVDIDKDKVLNNIQMDNDNDFDVQENTNITILKLKALCKKLAELYNLPLINAGMSIFAD